MQKGLKPADFKRDCPKCGLPVYKDKDGWLVNLGYLYQYHNTGCDDKHIRNAIVKSAENKAMSKMNSILSKAGW